MDAGSDCNFDVRGVTVQVLPEEDTFVVALSDEPDGDGRLLMFQLGTAAFDEQDVGLGQDTYCLCDEIGTTVYGGVTSCVLAGDLLTIQLDDEAATALGTGKECQLRLLVDARSVASVAQGLKRSSPAPIPRLRDSSCDIARVWRETQLFLGLSAYLHRILYGDFREFHTEAKFAEHTLSEGG